MNWLPLNSIDQFKSAVIESDSVTFAVFKHSTRCSISVMVKNRLERTWSLKDFPIYYLDLLNHRDISNYISESLNVEHESPQLLIIKNKDCIWHKSHTDITFESFLKEVV